MTESGWSWLFKSVVSDWSDSGQATTTVQSPCTACWKHAFSKRDRPFFGLQDGQLAERWFFVSFTRVPSCVITSIKEVVLTHVCLFVSRITKLLNWFAPNLVEGWGMEEAIKFWVRSRVFTMNLKTKFCFVPWPWQRAMFSECPWSFSVLF